MKKNNTIISSQQRAIINYPYWLRWGFFALLAFCLTAKCTIWHMQFFAEKQIPFLAIVCSSLLLASGVLLCKRRPWWFLLLLVAANTWLFANYAYERAWGQMLSMDMIRMAGNLRGFEDSVLAYFHTDMLYWMLAPDVLCVIALCFWRRVQARSWCGFSVIVGVYLLLIPIQQIGYYNQVYDKRVGYNNNTGLAAWWYVHEPLFNLFAMPQDVARTAFMTQDTQNWERSYVHSNGIVRFGPALCAFDYSYRRWKRTLTEVSLELTPEEQEKMAFLTAPEPDFHPQRSFVFILVESLESWAVDYPLNEGYIMPHLHRFIHSHATYYSPHMNNQLGYGGSSDGQLMALTGLLPVLQGVSVALYGDQPFPNYCHFYPYSITLNPSPGTWKQDVVNPNYGIKVLEESDSIRDDAGIFRRLNTIDLSEPTFVLAITVSSHVPFSKGDEIDLLLDEDMPGNMQKYLKCLHYMDEQLGTFLSRVDTDPVLCRSDIVITGDHTIFYPQDWAQMQQYAENKGISCLGTGVNTTPFILYSPTFNKAVYDERDIYQMDIYPTILHMIGCFEPAWKGLGLDLLGDGSRLFGTDNARALSDKLIRSRYFSQHP